MKMFNRTFSWAAGVASTVSATAPAGAAFDQTHAAFERVLKGFVKDARVDYAGLKGNPAELEDYLNQVAAVPEGQFRLWVRWRRPRPAGTRAR